MLKKLPQDHDPEIGESEPLLGSEPKGWKKYCTGQKALILGLTGLVCIADDYNTDMRIYRSSSWVPLIGSSINM